MVGTLNGWDRSKKKNSVLTLAPKRDPHSWSSGAIWTCQDLQVTKTGISYLNRFNELLAFEIIFVWDLFTSSFYITTSFELQSCWVTKKYIKALKILLILQFGLIKDKPVDQKPDSTSLHRSLNRKNFDSASLFWHLSAS